MPVYDAGEDLIHRVIVKGADGNYVQVTGESPGDVITTPSRGAHGADEQLQQKTKYSTGVFTNI